MPPIGWVGPTLDPGSFGLLHRKDFTMLDSLRQLSPAAQFQLARTHSPTSSA